MIKSANNQDFLAEYPAANETYEIGIRWNFAIRIYLLPVLRYLIFFIGDFRKYILDVKAMSNEEVWGKKTKQNR